MSTIKIEASIDLTNSAHVTAALVFMQSLAGGAKFSSETAIITNDTPPINVFQKALEKEKNKTKLKTKVEETPATDTHEANGVETPEDDLAIPKDEPKKEAGEVIKIEKVRAVLSTKINDHRDAIKAKLTELEASSVTTLKAEKYAEFIEYLNSL